MTAHIRSVAGPVLGVLLAFWGFGAAADRDVRPVRGRALLEASSLPGEWSSPAPHGDWSHVIQSRTAAPGLRLTFPAADAYRVRVFYRLEGNAAGGLLVGKTSAGSLEPGMWRRVAVDSPFVPKGEPWVLTFRVPEGGRLSVRRVDYRNHLARAGSRILLKPREGWRASASPTQTGLFLFALALLGAWASMAGPGVGGGDRLARSVWLGGGGAGALLVLQRWMSPYPLHAAPLALGILLLAVAGAGLLMRLTGGGRALLRRAGLAAAGILVALLLAEGILWAWDPPISRPRIGSYAVYSREFGWLNRPNTQGWQVDVGYHIRINRYGHRGGEHPEKKPAGVFRILGLGDSFTFGWGVAEEHTFLQVLERKLREAGHRVQVLNAAVPAWHSSQALHYLAREGPRFEPDLVVMSFFMDDVFYQTVENIRRGGKAQELRAEEASERRRRAEGVTRIRLYNAWFNYKKILRAARDYRRRNPYPSFEAERAQLLSRAGHMAFERKPANVEGLEKMLREWGKVRGGRGLPVIFTFIPAGGALGFPELQGHARALQRGSATHGFPYVDVVSALERQPDPRGLYLHPRDGHMSASGHAVIGEALADLILKGKWLKAKPPRG